MHYRYNIYDFNFFPNRFPFLTESKLSGPEEVHDDHLLAVVYLIKGPKNEMSIKQLISI